MQNFRKGGFTLPGEAGYEKLTLEMAERWGADVIRDSDGTKLSPEITDAGYRVYSTICIIREHNEFAESHPEAQQQTFLSSDPVLAVSETVEIRPMEGYFSEQFEINDTPEAMPEVSQVYGVVPLLADLGRNQYVQPYNEPLDKRAPAPA